MSDIEWTDVTSAVHAAVAEEQRVDDRFMDRAALRQKREPRIEILVLLLAVAGTASEHNVSRSGASTSADRGQVIDRLGRPAAVDARATTPLHQNLHPLGWYSADAALPTRGLVSQSERDLWIRRISSPVPFVDMGAATPLHHDGAWQPILAVSAPCETDSPLHTSLALPGANRVRPCAHHAETREPVGSGTINVEVAARLPCTADAAVFLAARGAREVFLERHADAPRCDLLSTNHRLSHATNVTRFVGTRHEPELRVRQFPGVPHA
jgi:hypothetical protein